MIRFFFTKQFLGFLAVGLFAAFLHWLARILLSIWLPFSIALIMAYGVGMAVAFLLNSFFVFPNSEKSRSSQIRDFILVNLAFFPVVWITSIQFNSWLIALGVNLYTEEIAHAIALSVPMLATFLIYKFFAFKERTYDYR